MDITEKDRILHLPFVVTWIEFDWKFGWRIGMANTGFPNYPILLNT